MRVLTFLFRVWAILFAAMAGDLRAEFRFEAAAAPELDARFQRTNGWIGADGSFSVPLSPCKTVWLFSDTIVGKVQDGKRSGAKMINNSIAIQTRGELPMFFYPTNKAGEPQSFIKPSRGEGHFWIFHGARNQKGLYFFLHRVKTVNPTPMGFRIIGLSLGRVKNPDDHPSRWRISQTEVPFSSFADGDRRSFGSAIMEDERWLYIYGTINRRSPVVRGTVLARVEKDDLGNFRDWRFYANGEWSKDCRKVTPILSDAPSESSAFFDSTLGRYVYLYSQGLKGRIVACTAPKPTGPWSEPVELFQCPEMNWSPKVFCYAAKAHPEIAKPGEWLVTYAANSHNFFELFTEPRLYWPRFVRVVLKP